MRIGCSAAQTGLNIVASPEARKVKVSLYLRNVTPEAALDAMCKSNDLWHKRSSTTGVIRIYTTKEYQRDLSTFREEQTEVFTLLYPNPVDVATAIRSIYGDRVILNLQSQSTGCVPGPDPAVQSFRRRGPADAGVRPTLAKNGRCAAARAASAVQGESVAGGLGGGGGMGGTALGGGGILGAMNGD